MNRLFVIGAAGVLASAAPIAVGATGAAIESFTGGVPFPSYWGGAMGDVVGYRFQVSAPIIVTSLGVWEDANGMQSPHMVGIWSSSQSLLRSTEVQPGDPLIGGFRYRTVPALVLQPGELYTIGAMYTGVDGDSYISGATTIQTSPYVTWVASTHPAAADLGFVYPEGTTTSFGRFGPNFLFAVMPSACAGDLNGDGVVDVSDLLILLGAWGACPAQEDCDVTWSCGQTIAWCDPGQTCFCVTGHDGIRRCVQNVACGGLQNCPDGTCPPGFTCIVNTCCGPAVCLPESAFDCPDEASPIAAGEWSALSPRTDTPPSEEPAPTDQRHRPEARTEAEAATIRSND